MVTWEAETEAKTHGETERGRHIQRRWQREIHIWKHETEAKTETETETEALTETETMTKTETRTGHNHIHTKAKTQRDGS